MRNSWLVAVVVVIGLINHLALAQTTRPSSAASDQSIESQTLRITPGEVQAASAKPGVASAVGTSSTDLTRIVIALAAVIGLILVLRALLRRVSGAAGMRGGKLVTVLSRSYISPKQQVVVLEVGKRLLVVGDSGGQMSSLCEITDPDEIATLIGRSRSGTTAKSPSAFANVFRRANESFDEQADADVAPETDAVNPDDAISTAEIGGLLDKVRMLQQQFNESKQAQLGSGNAT
jgi:flagellar protein FliO/FliZ